MALISSKKLAVLNTNDIGGSGQLNYYSQTSLLNTRIEFKSSKEHSSDDTSDEDISTQLKFKYNVLLPDTVSDKHIFANQHNKIKHSSLSREPTADEDELAQPKHTLYPVDNVMLEWNRIGKIGSGLMNLGNTCFMNSVLQCLTYCPPLVNYLCSIKEEHSANNKCRLDFCMLCLMRKHIEFVLPRNGHVIKPLLICQRLKSIAKHFTFGRQEDAHEFLRYVVDHMWQACLRSHERELGVPCGKFDHLSKSTTAINQIFGGYHRSQVICLNCKATSNTYDHFMDFMLEVQHVSSLQGALEKFITPEILRNENAYKCSKCKKVVMAKKHFTVHRAPNVATFQFKRFDCTRMFGKITKPIAYPEKLNLRPYMSEKNLPPVMYKLSSVLVHLGPSSNSGHYFCYVRNSNNCWYLMDDDSVSQVSLNEVLNQKAYVLFYVRLPHETPNKTNKPAVFSSQVLPRDRIPNTNTNGMCTNSKTTSNFHFNSSFKFKLTNASTTSDHTKAAITNNGPKEDTTQTVNLVTNPIKNSSLNTNQKSPVYSTSLPTTLVPYEKEDSDVESFHEKSKNLQTTLSKSKEQESKESSLSAPMVVRTTSSDQSLGFVPNSIVVNTTRGKDKEPLPVLKVKATTNSWQVVESNISGDVNERSDTITAPSKWTISETFESKTDSNLYEQKSCESNHTGLTLNGKIDVKKEHCNDIDSNITSKSSRKDKKKRKKKDKQKRKSVCTSDDSDDGSTELRWVERTKETLEIEHNNRHLTFEESAAPKRKFEQSHSDDLEERKKMRPLEGGSTKKLDILDSLLKNASRGYNDNVKSWDGNTSNLNRVISEERNNSNINKYDDLYNDEFDQGKVKKIKMNKYDRNNAFKFKSNPFQRIQHSKHYSSGSVSSSSSSSYSQRASHMKYSKFNNNNNFNSNSSRYEHRPQHERYHHEGRYGQTKNNGYHHHHPHHHRMNQKAKYHRSR